MSVTPTDEALIVALDFEGYLYNSGLTHVVTYLFAGVNSVERSPQEDTLLVLFNTAISNLVSTSHCNRDLLVLKSTLGPLPQQFCIRPRRQRLVSVLPVQRVCLGSCGQPVTLPVNNGYNHKGEHWDAAVASRFDAASRMFWNQIRMKSLTSNNIV